MLEKDAVTVALVVEDDQTLLDLLEERLLSMGHRCRKARSQAEADEMLDNHVFDYILLDLEIPSRSHGAPDIAYGQNLLRKIRQTPGHNSTPVLAITAHGLDSHHLALDMMKLGATDFVGKPFGRENPLEEKIREALRGRSGDRTGAVKAAPAKLTKFEGGDLAFYEDRVELCGIKVCGARNASIKRRVLDILRERTVKGNYRCFPMKDIADCLKLNRLGAVAEAVADFRDECRGRMRDAAGIDCENEDVVSNQNRGYHFRDWIKVLERIDEAEAAATERNVTLTEYQRAILRLLRKHAVRTPRNLSDTLSLPAAALAGELDGLFKAGLVLGEGNGANRKLRLAESGSQESPPSNEA
jgi:DNA-binding response OmpR family regulator